LIGFFFLLDNLARLRDNQRALPRSGESLLVGNNLLGPDFAQFALQPWDELRYQRV
jgi:hypothetical protein